MVREVTRSPGSQQWPVQECLAPLQPPVLHSLLLEAGSDKATHHGYTNLRMSPCTLYTLSVPCRYSRYYEPLLAPLTQAPVRLLEIGVEDGRSLAAWRRYFPQVS